MTAPAIPPATVVFPPDSPMGWGWRHVPPEYGRKANGGGNLAQLRALEFGRRCDMAHQFFAKTPGTLCDLTHYMQLARESCWRIIGRLLDENRIRHAGGKYETIPTARP